MQSLWALGSLGRASVPKILNAQKLKVQVGSRTSIPIEHSSALREP